MAYRIKKGEKPLLFHGAVLSTKPWREDVEADAVGLGTAKAVQCNKLRGVGQFENLVVTPKTRVDFSIPGHLKLPSVTTAAEKPPGGNRNMTFWEVQARRVAIRGLLF